MPEYMKEALEKAHPDALALRSKISADLNYTIDQVRTMNLLIVLLEQTLRKTTEEK